MITTTDPLTAARAAALFVSNLSASAHPTHAEVATAIRHAMRTHGGTRGCVADVAATYGDYPDLAAPRMRWARNLVESVYARQVRSDTPARITSIGAGRHTKPHHQHLTQAA